MLRDLLDRETEREDLESHEYLRTLCMLLWANNDPRDCVRIAKAKFKNFDAGCTVDEAFLVCGGLDETRARLADDAQAANAALKWIADWTGAPLRQKLIEEESRKWDVA